MTFSEFTYVFTTVFLPVAIVGYMLLMSKLSDSPETISDFGLGSILILAVLLFCNQQVPEKVAQAYQISVLVVNYLVTALSVAIIAVLMVKAQTKQRVIAFHKEKSTLAVHKR